MAGDVKQEHIVRQISAPSIILDDIAVVDTEYGTNSSAISDAKDYPIKYSKVQGAGHPLIQINNFLFRDEDIVYVKIDTSGFLPSISVTLLIRNKSMYTAGFPKDGDILSIFIRSKDDDFKPIRNDYEITGLRVHGEIKETTSEFMEITGVLYVEGLKDMKCSFNNGTSIDVLQEIAENLQLGFATNEISTKDEQKWISPYRTTQDHIQEIAGASWKDEKSFFTSFVDIFYHLNFVNVDPLFSIEPGKELGISIEDYSTDYDTDSELIKTHMTILFTNHRMARYSSNFVLRYSQINKANQINRKHGYVKYNHYYDALLKKKVMFFNDPLTSPGSENEKYIFKGRNSEDQRFNRVTHNWMGTMYGGNGENQHPKYIYAKTWNSQNMVHLDKLYLEVELSKINMNIRKYQVIPLLIIVHDDEARRKYNEPEDLTNSQTPTTQGTPDAQSKTISEEDLPYVVEKFYSGNYVVQDIFYEYEKGDFKQKIKLLRREWPIPPSLPRGST
jgi:hypothetical protein